MKRLINYFPIVFIALNFQVVHSAKILFLLPVASKSHVHVFEPLIRALGERGHEITSYTSMASKGMPKSVKEVVVYPVEEIFKEMQSPFLQRQMGKLAAFTNISMDYLENACNAVFDSNTFQDTLKNGKFDLIVVDIMLNYCMLGVIPHFKAPSIYLTTMAATTNIVDPLGTKLPSSFVPSSFLDLTDRMNFFERLLNFSFNIFMDIIGTMFFLPRFEKIFQDKLGIDTRINEIAKNVSLVLVNSHFTLTYPRPHLPDVIEVGGMHAKPAKPLPKDLDDFISGAEHGCIFFSLGSIAKGSDMPEEYRKIFVNAFSKLKQRVLWKWETDDMPGLPKNVKLGKWLPQQDILGHKNVILFMTHGGLLSIQEAVYHGKPLIGIPLFADQDLNVKQAEKAGFSISLEILTMTEEILESKLREVLENESYTTRAKELSTLWRDQPLSPLDTAIFWTEYVIRHKGALHMRSAARDLNFFQYHSLDVIAFLSAILISVLLLLKCILKFLIKKICGSKQATPISLRKKKN